MKTVKISAFGRLHFALVNLSEAGEYINGGAGAMIWPPVCSVTASPSTKLSVFPVEYTEEVFSVCRCLNVGADLKVCIEFDGRMCWHIGLGFHTQLRMAIATAVLFALDLNIDTENIPRIVMRGGTSGIGSLGFWLGGLLFDRGRKRPKGHNIFVPSVMARDYDNSPLVYQKSSLPFYPVVVRPANWEKIHGDKEKVLFSRFTPIPEGEAQQSGALVYGDLKKAVIDEEFEEFCQSLDKISSVGFKKREISYRGEAAIEMFELMRNLGLSGVGMSSWGPICFGFSLSKEVAENVALQLQDHPLVEDAWVANFASGATVQINGGEIMSAYKAATLASGN